MAHTDLHAKTEASVAKAQAANKETYNTLKTDGTAKPTTPNETQTLAESPKYSTIHKCSLTRSDIYTRLMPDGTTGALRIDGPILPNAPGGGAFIALRSDGKIILRTGPKSTDSGSESGTLDIRTNGQFQRHEGRSQITYCQGGTEGAGQALNVLFEGDVVETASGCQRTIKAKKIVIEATEELWLIGKTEVKIQAGGSGGGVISLTAGTIEQKADNSKETITGQKMVYGVAESQMEQFDPRANFVVNSSGQMNLNVLGAYNTVIGGAVDWKVGGAYNMDIGGLYANKVGGAASITAGGDASIIAGAATNITAAGASTFTAGGVAAIVSGGITSINAGEAIDLTAGEGVDIFGGANVSIRSEAEVSIKGTLIYLN